MPRPDVDEVAAEAVDAALTGWATSLTDSDLSVELLAISDVKPEHVHVLREASRRFIAGRP